jgi:nitrite reductase/ring-hydroxylating ferredoxin subunit
MLISGALMDAVGGDVVAGRTFETVLRGTSEKRQLHEVVGLTPSGAARVAPDDRQDPTRKRFAGREWLRVLPDEELPAGGRKVIQLDPLDLLLIRADDRIFAINNACPHLHLPLSESEVTDDCTIVCRWHESRFDLRTGEILEWCPALHADGRPKGMEHVGDVSKNRSPLHPLAVRIHDRHIWVSLD